MAGLIDVAAEIERLEKAIDKRRGEVARSEKKLSNDSFVDNAPPEVVEQERSRLEDHRAALEKLSEQLEKIRALR